MDSLDLTASVDLSKLSDNDKRELNQFIVNESQLGARRKGQPQTLTIIILLVFICLDSSIINST